MTGIGSLPQRTLSDAFAFLDAYPALAPFKPEIPLGGLFETMLYAPFKVLGEPDVRRFLSVDTGPSRVVFEDRSLEDLLRLIASYAGETDEAFERTLERTPRGGTMFTSIVGPATLLSLVAVGSTPAAAIPELRDHVVVLLERRVGAELDRARHAGRKLLCHLDEPLLPFLPHETLSAVALPMLRAVVDSLRQRGTVGLHCCGVIVDDRLAGALRSLSLPLLSTPLPPETPGKELVQATVDDGGIVMLGCVRTDRVDERTAADVAAEIAALIPASARGSVVLTPDCGLGLLGEKRAAAVLTALETIARELLRLADED